MSELLGKSTIDTNTYGKSTGHSGNYSTNYQNTGRELMTPDEVRMLDNAKALLFIRGERPVMDDKFDILKHPGVHLTPDGGGKVYVHGTTEHAVAGIKNIVVKKKDNIVSQKYEATDPATHYELLSNEELEAIFLTNQEE